MLRWKFTLNPDTDAKEISEPRGWVELPFTLKRDRTWHGIFFEHSKDLVFYNDPTDSSKNAYTYVQDQYESFGVEGYVILKVELACSDTDDFTQEARWRLNFTSYKETRGVECFITLNLEESDCLMTFKNRYDQPVSFNDNLSFDGSELDDYDYLNFNLTLPPKTVLQRANLNSPGFIGAEGNSHPDVLIEQEVSAGTGTVEHQAIGYFGFGLEPGPGTAFDDGDGLDEIDDRENTGDMSATSAAGLPPNFTIEVGGDYTFTFNVQGRIIGLIDTNANNTDCGGLIGDQDTFNHIEYQVYLEAGGTTTLVFSESDDDCFSPSREFTSIPMGVPTYTYALNAGDEVKLYIRVRLAGEWNHDLIDSHPIFWTIQFDGTAAMDIVAYTRSTPSTCLANMVNETFSRIAEKITDDCFRVLSNYYGRTDSQPYPAPSGIDGCGSLRALMSGLDIRQYTSGRLTISMKKMFDDKNAIDNIGLGLEDDAEREGYQVLRIEPYKYFYSNDIVIQIDRIPLVVIDVRREDHYSMFKGGYAKYEAEEYFGLDEFLTERNYRTTLTSVKNSLNQVCTMIASGYAIEITRRQKLYSETTSEDWRFDNDVFVVCLKRGVSTPIEVEQGNITGEANMIDPSTIYNFRISPARNAMRWLSTVLNSYRDPEAVTSELIFTDGKGNILATGLMTGDCIVESAAVVENQTLDCLVTDDPLDALPIFIPETWAFETDLSFSDYQDLKANPKGTIQCRFGQDDTWRDFFLDECTWIPNRQTANFRLMPKRTYPIDQCRIYIIQTRGNGTNVFGSGILVGAELEDLFVFVNGRLQKYNNADTSSNEIVAGSWNPLTGYGLLDAAIPNGQQVTIIHLPTMNQGCEIDCLKRYEGRATGSNIETLAGMSPASIANSFIFVNGNLQKFNDDDSDNIELLDLDTGTSEATFSYETIAGQEIRAFGIRQCDCLLVYSGRGDGTNMPTVSDLGIATLANIFVFYNGNLQKYNDSDTSNNELTAYDSVGETVTLNYATHAGRELRAFKLSNDC